MDNILRMIDAAIAATGESVALVVGAERHDDGEFFACLSNAETATLVLITLESDWETQLHARGATIADAIAALDALCARDFS